MHLECKIEPLSLGGFSLYVFSSLSWKLIHDTLFIYPEHISYLKTEVSGGTPVLLKLSGSPSLPRTGYSHPVSYSRRVPKTSTIKRTDLSRTIETL